MFCVQFLSLFSQVEWLIVTRFLNFWVYKSHFKISGNIFTLFMYMSIVCFIFTNTWTILLEVCLTGFQIKVHIKEIVMPWQY